MNPQVANCLGIFLFKGSKFKILEVTTVELKE